MAYPASGKIRNFYSRPKSMIDAITYEKVALDARPNLREITIEAPAALKVFPESSYRLYTEPDVIDSPGTNVICSGTALLINEGSSTGDARLVGVLKKDAAPGDNCVCVVEGLHLFQADPTIGAADTLNGAAAYYDVDDGLVYTGAGATSNTRLIIGSFQGGISEMEPSNIKISGYQYVSVMLNPGTMEQNTAATIPSDASSLTNTATPYVKADISAFGGLTQTFTISASSPKPAFQGGDLTLTVAVEGTTIYSGPFINTVTATYPAAGSSKSAVFTVTDPDGTSGNATYTVTVHATNAPASWARS